MSNLIRTGFVIAAIALTLSGCGINDREPELMNIRSAGDGPDEFAILPTLPLEEPASYSDLPTPTPGGTNLTDPNPQADAIAALGGRRSSVVEDGNLGSDGGLITYATRYGVASGIRSTLAAEDLDFRRRNNGRLMERLFNVNVYFDAYQSMTLDQYAELLRLRRLGIWTPAAPPEGYGQ